MVLGSHVATSGGGLTPRLGSALDTIAQAGVELFFSLSGFLIGGILLRMSRQGLSPGSVGRFMLRRWFRTLPLYFILLVTAGAWFGMDIRHSLMLVQNFYPAEPRALPVSWSLVMEEYFYVAFPLGMVALHILGVRGPRLVGAMAAVLIVCCAGIRLWNAYGFGPGWPAPFVHENPLLRLDCAAYGAAGAWLTSRAPRGVSMAGVVPICAGTLIVAVASTSLVWVLGASIGSLVAAGFLRWGPAFLALQTTASDIGFALVVIGLSALSLRLPRPCILVVKWVSLTSYSIYLVHVPVIGILSGLSGVSAAFRVVAVLSVTFAVSAITYHAIEKPFLRLRDAVVPEV